MNDELVALLGDRRIGALRSRGGRTSFRYDGSWLDDPDAIPLSLSMPLAVAEHSHRAVEPFLWGLLPDNEVIIGRWAQRFQVSAHSAFALLKHVGEECAGAVRFVSTARVSEVPHDSKEPLDADVAWLTEAEVADRMRDLRRDASAWRRRDDHGHFSLGGAQPKTALYFDGTRYGVPSGRTATTHILKPDLEGLDGHSINEHLCLEIARTIGIPAAHSRALRFEDELAIVVERYDRIRINGRVARVHQEDVCQALAIHPTKKYERDGGPGARTIAALLRESSRAPSDDLIAFTRALALAWLIGGTDAHGKNYSVLLGRGSRARLAPLYDVASVLPYTKQPRKLTLAMKLGDKYRMEEIGVHEWSKMHLELGLEHDEVRTVVIAVAERLREATADACRHAKVAGITHPIVDRLESAIVQRVTRSLRLLVGTVW